MTSISDSATATIRQYMFGVNLQATYLFARKAREVQVAGQPLTHEQRRHEELSAYVSAAVLHATGFLEATINEFIMDIVDGQHSKAGPVSESVRQRLRTVWLESLKSSATILPKYQVALSAFDKPTFDKGQQPFQAAAVLVKVRNRLVHHLPESTEVLLGEKNVESPQDIVDWLKPFIEMNPWHEGATTGPLNRVLWAGCAEWALRSAVAFSDEFFSRASRPRPYDFIVQAWGTKKDAV